MKTIFSQSVGGDGATISLGSDGTNLVLAVNYPLAKLTGPVDSALDAMTKKLEAALGNSAWADAILDPLDAAGKAELASLISGI